MNLTSTPRLPPGAQQSAPNPNPDRSGFLWHWCITVHAAGADILKTLALPSDQRKHESMNSLTPFQATQSGSEVVAFHRTELSLILALYGRMVAAGEWRDYGISCLRDVAVFSIFRRTAENPLYRVEKRPKLRGKQGQYAVVSIDGQVLKRGSDLRTVLRVLERKMIRAID